MGEVKVIACNYAVHTNTSRKGSLCYVLLDNPGWGNERIVILNRSRSGRWIERWERIDRLTNFRLKTIVAVDPIYEKVKGCCYYEPGEFQTAEIRERIARLIDMRPRIGDCGFEPKGMPRV